MRKYKQVKSISKIIIFIFSISFYLNLFFPITSLAASDAQIIEQANLIVEAQHSSGAIAMAPQFYPSDPDASPIWINPYFANYSAIALLSAYQKTSDVNYLNAVANYMNWYISNLNGDGTIYDFEGNWQNFAPKDNNPADGNPEYDSTDSYAATFLVLIEKHYTVTNSATWMQNNITQIKLIASAIDLTLKDDDLTEATPSYPVKYLMDNLEVRLGMLAGINIATALNSNDPTFSPTYFTLRNNTTTEALRSYWDTTLSAYNWAKQSDNSFNNYNESQWSTSGQANAMALSYYLDTRDSASVSLLNKIITDYPIPSDARDYFFLGSALRKFGNETAAQNIENKIYLDLSITNTYTSHRANYILLSLLNYNDLLFNNDLTGVLGDYTAPTPSPNQNNQNNNNQLAESGSNLNKILTLYIIHTFFTCIIIFKLIPSYNRNIIHKKKVLDCIYKDKYLMVPKYKEKEWTK